MTEKTIFSEAYTNDICKVFEDNVRYDAPLSTSTDNGGFKRLKDANLSDNFMFAKVMSDPTILKEFLQIVLGIKIRRIVMTQYEKTIFPTRRQKVYAWTFTPMTVITANTALKCRDTLNII